MSLRTRSTRAAAASQTATTTTTATVTRTRGRRAAAATATVDLEEEEEELTVLRSRRQSASRTRSTTTAASTTSRSRAAKTATTAAATRRATTRRRGAREREPEENEEEETVDLDQEENQEEDELVKKTTKRGRKSASKASRSSSRTPSRSRSTSRARIAPSPARESSRTRRQAAVEDEEVDQQPFKTPVKTGRRSPQRTRQRDGSEGDEEGLEDVSRIVHVRSPPPPTPRTAVMLREQYLKKKERDQVAFGESSTPSVVAKPEGEALSRTVKTALIVAFYFVSSISVVFLNKALANNPKYEPFTVTITIMQMIGSVLISALLGNLSPFFAELSPTLARTCPRVKIYGPVISQTLLTSALFAITLCMNNICLQLVNISFYQVARAWTIICSLVLSYIFVKSEPFPPPRVLICCFVIVAGYVIAIIGKKGLSIDELNVEFGEQYRSCSAAVYSAWTNPSSSLSYSTLKAIAVACAPRPSMLGLVFGFLGSLALAAYSLSVNRDQRRLPISDALLAVHVNLAAATMLIAYIAYSGELGQFLAAFPTWEEKLRFVFAVIPVTIAGHLISFATYLQISQTSPLTHNVSGTAKASLQSICGWWWNNEEVSLVTAIGTAINVIGCMAYGMVRHAILESRRKEKTAEERQSGPEWESLDQVPYSNAFKCVGKTVYRFVTAPPELPASE